MDGRKNKKSIIYKNPINRKPVTKDGSFKHLLMSLLLSKSIRT